MAENPPEHEESLWWLALSPSIWAVHFLACYITVALWCERVVGHAGHLGTARWLGVGYTALALAGIGWAARHGYRRHRFGFATIPHDFDTPEDRHRFLGFATFLLSLLSAVGVLYVAVPFVFMATCR